MRLVKILTALAILVGAGLVAAQPASAAPGATINSITIIGCVITVNVTVEDGGAYYLQVWDDGNQLAGEPPYNVPTGGTVDMKYTVVDEVLQGAAGLGLYVADGPDGDAEIFDSDGSYAGADDVSAACEASGGTDSGAPPGAIINDATADGCSLGVDVTSTGLGEYTLVVLDGDDVIVDQDFTGTAGQQQVLAAELPDPTVGTLDIVIEDAETGEEYDTAQVDANCDVTPTTPSTAAPTSSVAADTGVRPRFTG
jgi:hypothetical protein